MAETTRQPREIPIRESFDSNQGSFSNYDALDVPQRAALLKQRHTDIRSFWSEDYLVPFQMLHLDTMTLADLIIGGQTVDDLDGANIIGRLGEKWSFGTVGRLPSRNNWHGITVTVAPGSTTETQSTVPNV